MDIANYNITDHRIINKKNRYNLSSAIINENCIDHLACTEEEVFSTIVLKQSERSFGWSLGFFFFLQG